MRILHVGKFYPPHSGGIETFLANLAGGTAARGHEVEVLCFSGGSRRSEESVNGVQVVRYPASLTAFSQPLSPGYAAALSSRARQADLVHVHCPNPFGESAVLGLSAVSPGFPPYVVSFHSDIVRQRALGTLYAPVLRLFLGRAAAIVAATESHVRHSPLLSPMAARCRTVPYGISTGHLAETPEVARGVLRLRQRLGRYVLFVGRLVGYKGVIHLIRAMREVDATAAIVGDGPLREELEHEAAAAGVASKVHFAGEVRDPVLFASYYRGCDAFVLPSVTRAEAFGIVLLEAMACAKPLVTTRLDSGVSLVNREGVTGVAVPPADSAALAAAINGLLADEALRSRMGAAGRDSYLSSYSREAMVEAYLGIYREAASAKTASIPR